MKTLTVAQLTDSVGLDLGCSEWITIGQKHIDAFADITGDHQWIHVDPHRAAIGPFGCTIAHGFLTLSLVSRIVLELLDVPDASSAINYGVDRVRFPAPVPVDARVRGHAQLVSTVPTPTGVQTSTRVTVECDRTDKPVAVADVLNWFVN